MIRAVVVLISNLTPVIVNFVSFGIFIALGNNLTAEVAFSSLALFNMMRQPLNMFPSVITQFLEARVSMQRLQKFFLNEELDSKAIEESPDSEFAVQIKNGNFHWGGHLILEDVNLDIPRGALVAIVGEVGSGKSSLLQSFLGEIPKSSGKVFVNGSTAYVPQTAWLKNDSVRDNIIFMNEFEPSHYKNTIKVCQLRHDLKVLPAGDQTEIGEKGINLSGGQKQRVSMARAVYSDKDIYILDDPLSAVDAHVGKALFWDCIKGKLNGKTRILATHQLFFLKDCDFVVVINKGKILEFGTFEELMKKGGRFTEMMQGYVTNDIPQTEMEAPESPEKRKKSARKSQGKKLIQEENKGAGSVKWLVYYKYTKALGGFFILCVVMVLFLAEAGAALLSNYWLSYWSVVEDIKYNNITFGPSETFSWNGGRSLKDFGFGPEKIFDELGLGVFFYLMIYGILGFITGFLIILRSFVLAQAGVEASQEIHDEMTTNVLHVPISYFDTVPVGRIINRFSSDLNTVDTQLPLTLGNLISFFLSTISVIFVIATVTPVFLVILLPLMFLYNHTQKLYLRSSREIQRLISISRSPIFAIFGEVLNGITTIRAYRAIDYFLLEFNEKVQENNQALYMSFAVLRWLAVRLDFFATCIIFAASFFAVLGRNQIDPGLAGLSLTYALRLTQQLNILVRMTTDMENNLVSVERCLQISDLKTEAPYKTFFEPPSYWPNRGEISIENLSLRYRPDLPLVLAGVSAHIKPQEKIGIVGRTGAGKSSLLLALFRIVEPATGKIVIDGENIINIGLHDLRKKLAIIPQDPILFCGTIRSNLDPFGKYSDEQLWGALEASELKTMIQRMNGQLDAPVSEYGENLSHGTRQLMCLARALLKRSKILVMDEATANVDFETDNLIQRAIRQEFKDVTVITIAHRLNTIMDYDRVMVFNEGNIAEFDSPRRLLADRNSLFYGLAKEVKLSVDLME